MRLLAVATFAVLTLLSPAARAEGGPEKEVARFLDGLSALARDGKRDAVYALVDFTRFIAEVRSWSGVAEFSPADEEVVERGARYAAEEVLASAASKAPEILAVRSIAGGDEAIVIARHRYGDGRTEKLRWRLVRRDGAYRVYDVGPLGFHLPLSLLVASGLDLLRKGGSETDLIVVSTLARIATALQAGMTEEARRMLTGLEKDRLPARIDGVRHLFWATLLVMEQKPDLALERLTKADRLNPGMPFVAALRAVAFNGMGLHEKALGHARLFIEATGGDATGWQEAGTALARLDRAKEARDAFAAMLRDDPDSLAEVADSLRARRWHRPLLALAAAAKSIAPDDASVAFYEVQAHSFAGRHAKAAAKLLPLLDRIDGESDRAAWRRVYLDEMIAAGRPLTGAAALGNRAESFRYVGTKLAENRAKLAALVILFEERHPEDPWVSFFSAEVLAMEDSRDAAETAYAEAMAAATVEEDREKFRVARVYNLYRAGRAVAALATVPPRRRTLKQLVWLCGRDGNRDELDEILVAQAEADPKDPAYLLCATEPDWLDGKWAAVVKALLAKRKEILADRENLYDFEDRLVRGLLRSGFVDQALRAAKEIEKRDDDPWYTAVALAKAARAEELEQVLATLIDRGFTIADFYEDEDLGAALRSEPLESVRSRFPPPK